MSPPKTDKKPRALPREMRREQLIDATMTSIAKHGLSGTTMATITREAGLSMGIANLHFQSKDKLLEATLERVTGEFSEGQNAILGDNSHASLTHTLRAMVDFNFSARVTHKNKLAVWFAFWGEARFRPTYQRICNKSDAASHRAISDLFADVIKDGGYQNMDAKSMAAGYTALLDGLWLDLLITPRAMTRKMAHAIAVDFLARAFPRHIHTANDN